VDTYLIKHHQNTEKELLQARVLEQSSSGVEQSHVKQVLKGKKKISYAPKNVLDYFTYIRVI
jgi:hypothetical protein